MIDQNVKKLYLSRTDKKIAGVCGGLGKFFGVDAVFFRIGFVLTLFCGGMGLIIYLLMWAIVPREQN